MVKADINDIHTQIAVEGGGITIYSKEAAEKDMGFNFDKYSGVGMTKITFLVKDIELEYERLKSMNAEIIIPPTTYPWGARSMHFRDPEGNIVCFVNG